MELPTKSELIELLPYLSQPEREELEQLIAGIELPIWAPQTGPQSLAVHSPADILGYGGAAGGGKTDLILGLALTEHKRTLILRREGTQLKAIIDRSKEIIGAYEKAKQASFNETSHIWRGLPDKRMIQMAGIPRIGDEKKFQGQPHDLKAFDEATEIAESQFRFVIGWNRSSNPKQRCRVVAVFNPPTTEEGKWVIKYWSPWLDPKHPNPAVAGELRYFTTINGEEIEVPDGKPFLHKGKMVKVLSRTFVFAKLSDNAYYSGGNYEAVLMALPEPLRSQMLNGDFTAGIEDDPWQVIPTEWVKLAQERWKALHTTTEGQEKLQELLKTLSCIGVDVARGGADKTVLALRHHNYFAPLMKYPGKQTPDGPAVAALVAAQYRQGSGAPINVDVIGVGSSAYDQLRVQGFNSAVAVNFAEGSSATDKSGKLKFINLRAEIYWKLREALDPVSGQGLALPDDSELLSDLCAPRWVLQANGIKIESKDDIKARIGRSPDCADAIAYAFYQSPVQSILDWYKSQYDKMKGQQG